MASFVNRSGILLGLHEELLQQFGSVSALQSGQSAETFAYVFGEVIDSLQDAFEELPHVKSVHKPQPSQEWLAQPRVLDPRPSIGKHIAQYEVTMPLVVNLVSADEAAAAAADAEVTEEVVILRSARAQEQAREHADRGEFEQAHKLLSEAAHELRRFAPASAKADEILGQAETLETNSRS